MSVRVRIVALLALIGLLSSACGVVSAPEAATTTTEAIGAADSGRTDGSGATVAAVTFGDYETAVLNVVACMQNAGAPITEPVLNPESGQFEFDWDPASATTYEECDDEFSTIETAYLDSADGPPLDSSGPIGDWSGAEAASWVRLLASIPETANTRYAAITIIDLARAAERLDIDRPGARASDAAVVDYLGDLAAQAGIVPAGPFGAFGRSAYADQIRTELGFDHRNIDQIVSAGTGARELTVARGSWDLESIQSAVTSDLTWSTLLTTDVDGPATVHRWGIDFDLDLSRFSPTRPAGHHRRLAIADDQLLWARYDDGISDAVDAIEGITRSLADVDDLVALAAIADEEQLFTGVIAPNVAAFVADLTEQRRSEGLLRRPDAMLIGDGVDEQGRYTLIALRHSSEDVADFELVEFEQRIATAASTVDRGEVTIELEEPRDFDIRLIGPTLVARIWLTNSEIAEPADAPLPPLTTVLQFS